MGILRLKMGISETQTQYFEIQMGILRLKMGISETQTWYFEIQKGHSETQNGYL